MQATKEIAYLREHLEALTQMYNALSPLLDQLKELLNKQAFIPPSLEDSVKEQLSQIISSQKELLDRYALLGFGITPTEIPTMDAELEKHFKFLTEKQAFAEIILFVNSLHSTAPDIESELEKERSAVVGFNYAESSIEECQTALGKYFLLKQTLEETDAQKKFKLIMDQLYSVFNFQIVYGLNINAITYSDPDPAMIPSTSSIVQSKVATSVPEPEEAIEDPVDTSSATAETSSEKNSAENIAENSTIQTSEATDTADSIAIENELTWEVLGISKPDAVCYEVDNAEMEVGIYPKQKKFGVSNFKKDIMRGYTSEKILLMESAFDNNGVNAHSISRLFNREDKDFITAAEKLVQAGYFKEYTLKKNFFESYEPYYVLTPNGVKAFTTKEAAAVMDRRPAKTYTRDESIPDRANSLLTRIIDWKTKELMHEVCPSGDYGSSKTVLGTNHFVEFFSLSKSDKTYVYAGIFSSDIEEFSILKRDLETFEPHINVLMIVGMTICHAQTLANWIKGFLFAISPDTSIYYYDMETEQYYFQTDDSVATLYEDVPDENDSDSEVPTGVAKPSEVNNIYETTPTTATEEVTLLTDITTSNHELTEETIEEITNNEPVEDPASKQTDMTPVLDPPIATLTTNIQVVKSGSKSAVPALSSTDITDYTLNYQKMLASDKFYCATAYLTALANKHREFKSARCQLAYALNDPQANCTYSSDQLFSVYFTEYNQLSEYYTVSAVLRNYFLDQCSYDYSLQMLQGSISSFELLQKNVSLNQAVYMIQQFKSQNHRGIDFYADYRQKKRETFEETLRYIQAEARELYDNYCHGKDSGFTMRFINTKKLLYSDGTDIATFLEAIQTDNREYLPLIIDHLSSTYIKDGMDIEVESIDTEKIYIAIDDAWNRANTDNKHNKSSRLVGSRRMNLYKLLHRMVSVLCNYVSTVGSTAINDDDPGFIAYKRSKKSLVETLENAISYIHNNPAPTLDEIAGQHVLEYTIKTLLSRLDGSYEESTLRYFYLEFLQNDQVLLNDEYLPVLEDVAEIEELSVLSRIEAHYKSTPASLEQRLNSILNGADDYGSARLIQAYLKAHPSMIDNKALLDISIEKAITYPRKDMETRRCEFIEDLDLAQSYGQIDNTTEDRKETFIQIMDSWYDWAIESGNYGFFYKILTAIRLKIKEDAQVRAIDLERNLTLYKAALVDWEENEQLSSAIAQISARIETQNYAAAEDLLNRLIAGDLDTNIEFIQNDYLAEFLKEYTLNSTKAGKPSSTLQASLSRGHNKDSRAAGKLIDNWPKGNGTSTTKISDLLTTLGFAVEKVTSQPPIQGKDHFQVTLKRPSNGRKSNYKHPISAFGSEAEEKGFRVINIFGKMDASRLIDTFKEIGTAKNTLVLLDYALLLPDRRELARRTKTELNGKTFVVIDRVVLVYLASHYSETAVNRMLMAVTMPFTSYQPYVSDSSKIMPQEIFMGRKTELDKIESASGINIVYGGRQLGKSALLRMAQKNINNDENGDRAVLVDIKGLDYKAAAKKISTAFFDEKVLLSEHITDDWDELSRNIKNRLRGTTPGKPIPYLLLLMDEADVFIESCEAVDYRPFDALKDIQSIGSDRFKFVVAGLRNIVRFKKNIALSNNSVLTHLSSLTVTPFKSTEARELLEVPLSYLGFRFPEDSKTEMLISTIFGTTNYFPGLLQLYCSKLIEALQRDYAGYNEDETPPYIVKEAHIKKVLSDKTLEQQIREKYFITLKVDEDDYYYLIALLTAFNYHNNKGQNGCDAIDIIDIADSYGISKIAKLSRDKVTALMEEMRELNVLQQIGNGKYRFARHSFCQMMGNKSQIEDEIMAYAVEQGE